MKKKKTALKAVVVDGSCVPPLEEGLVYKVLGTKGCKDCLRDQDDEEYCNGRVLKNLDDQSSVEICNKKYYKLKHKRPYPSILFRGIIREYPHAWYCGYRIQMLGGKKCRSTSMNARYAAKRLKLFKNSLIHRLTNAMRAAAGLKN